jgi:hypothetical protein
MIHPDTHDYNRSTEAADREICERLACEISNHLPEADNRIWHGGPEGSSRAALRLLSITA